MKENPFRRVFAKRKQFYQRLSDQNNSELSTVPPLWRRHCHATGSTSATLPPGGGGVNLLTLNANIEPFAPFVIKHDSDRGMSYLAPPPAAPNAVQTKPAFEVTSDGQNVHYATSTINSEEGVESHLEVSISYF